MNELLKINYEAEQPTVSARDLHEQLNIKTAFKDWFPRMCEYGFEEGKDFCSKMSETSSKGGRPSKDADISIDMAKQICMIQRSPEGKQIRQYFIDLEKAWNTPEQIMARALKMANHSIESLKGRCKFLGEQVVEQQQIITELQPKANYVDMILQSKSLVTITQIAKDYGMSGRKLNKILKELKIQYKVGGQWVLYSKYQNGGYVHSRTIDITRTDGRAADGPKSVRVISVIEVKANRGLGIEKDPVRVVTQYWDMKGNLLAERDPDPQLLSDQVIWESKRLQNIIENHSKNDRNVMSRDGHATE